jgi:DNA-binding protein HU-beta
MKQGEPLALTSGLADQSTIRRISMTKAELVGLIAKEAGITLGQSKTALETIIEISMKALKKEGRFPLAGLGVFTVVKRARRKARNPRTGEPVAIKAHKAVKFKPSVALKAHVN